jgi:histidine ammonia-lyase
LPNGPAGAAKAGPGGGGGGDGTLGGGGGVVLTARTVPHAWVAGAELSSERHRTALGRGGRRRGVTCRVMEDPTVVVRGPGLRIADVVAVARHDAPAALDDRAREAMGRSAALVERMVAGDHPVYGVTTGFGSLATTVIPAARTAELQVSLVRSHAAGMGPPVEREVVRAMLLLRARSLAMGYSGARPELVDLQLAMLRAGITPVVREHGSLGASGDLAPLAHCALALIGEGEVWDGQGRAEPAAAALQRAGLPPVALRAKEGLALINGTDGMLGMLVLAVHDLDELLRLADVTAAMSVEALLGTDRAFADDLLRLRPQHGQARSAANLRRLLHGSPIVASHRHDDPRVQDAYSLRCTPQVHGAAQDTLAHARAVAERELDAAIDNPMILPDGRVESGGNFHGAPLAFVCDFLAIAAAEVCAIAERRTDRLLDAARSHGLPPFLATDAGVNSGLMIAHYTQAATALEVKRLAGPASVESLPTSAMQEDHVSNGWAAARKLRRAVDGVRRVLAVELVCAAAALDLRSPLTPAAGTGAALAALREQVAGPGADRWWSPDLCRAEQLLANGRVLGAVESAVGPLETEAIPSDRRSEVW